MRDLPERVDAGVGAPRSLHVDDLAAELRHGLFERALHGRTVVLDLPADKRPAVIFDGELVAWHGLDVTFPGENRPGGRGKRVGTMT